MGTSYKNCTIFVGIDQSLNSTGYYIKELSKGKPTPDIKGLIEPGSRRGGKRLAYIFDTIDRLLQDYEPSKVLLCMEGYAYGYRAGRVFELGEVGGIIKLYCARVGIECMTVPPTELKKFVTGKGSASKKAMMESTGERKNDIADAKGLSWIAEEICLRTTKERSKMEVIKSCLDNSRTSKKKPKYKRSNRTAAEVSL